MKSGDIFTYDIARFLFTERGIFDNIEHKFGFRQLSTMGDSTKRWILVITRIVLALLLLIAYNVAYRLFELKILYFLGVKK